jgi:capsular polysaccharide biosynthesis protein
VGRADGQEFIIRTQRSGVNDVYVSRRYGDFRRLAEEVS